MLDFIASAFSFLLKLGGLVILGALVAALPFAWGMDTARWAIATGVRRREAYLRAMCLPAVILLGGNHIADNRSLFQHSLILWLVIIAVTSAAAGVRWELGGRKVPQMTGRWCVDEYDSGVFKCWKFDKVTRGLWPYEVTLQDTYRKDYAFAWFGICENCGAEARDTSSGPWKQ